MPYFVRGWQKVFPGSTLVDESLLEEDEEQLNIWDQTVDLGYDSHIPKGLLNSLLYMTIFYHVKVLIYFIAKFWSKRNKGKHTEKLEKFRDTLFYQELILILIEGYIEFVIMVYIYFERIEAMEHPIWSNVTVFYYIIMCGVVLPVVFIWLYTRPLEVIQKDPEFNRKWGSLFDEKRTNEKPQVMFYLVFVLRRLFYVSAAFNLVGYNYF